jgi:acetyl-CoA carboxylase carboxyltransferase component
VDAGAGDAHGLDELRRREAMARAMGGIEAVERHHAHGKLTARERIDLLADSGSFDEFGVLAGAAQYEHGELASFVPKSHVDGTCSVDGRKVVVSAGDFTVRGGSASGGHGLLGQEPSAPERALRWRLPFVRLLDAAGGSVRTVEAHGRTYLPDGNTFTLVDTELLNTVPVASAVMGSVAGLPAVNACLSHWSVIVRGTGQLFPGGPPVVKAALGYDIAKEALGGAHIHTGISGVVDNVAESEEEALAQVRAFLSYLPSSVHELPPRDDPADPVGAAADLRDLVDPEHRRPFDVHRLLAAVVDDGSLFEIAPRYGRSRVTALARVDGYAVGVMANDPRFLGGATDVAAGDKVIRLIQLCELFHLPLISFADEPGFMVGLESEKHGIERAGARLVWTLCQSTVPMLAVVIGRLYGVAGQCHHRPTGMYQRYAWPTARWGSMHISGGASAAYRREIEQADDPNAKRLEVEQRLQALTSPFRTAEATAQDIIDPATTRLRLVEFVRDAQRVLALPGAPSRIPYRP